MQNRCSCGAGAVLVLLAVLTSPLHAATRLKHQWFECAVPQMTVPKVDAAPALDGTIDDDGEWRFAAGFTGLMAKRDPYVLPLPMQGHVRIMRDDANLFVALRSPLPPAFRFAPKGIRYTPGSADQPGEIEKGDHWALRFIVGDPKKNAPAFLFNVNPAGDLSDQKVLDEHRGQNRHQAGLEYNSGAKVAAALHDADWHVEMAIPLASLDLAGNVDVKTPIRAMFSRGRGYNSMDTSYAEWNRAESHFAVQQSGRLLWGAPTPAFQLLGLGPICIDSRLTPAFRVSNPTGETRKVTVRMTVESGAEVLHEQTAAYDLKPGEVRDAEFEEYRPVLKEGWTGRVCWEVNAGDDHLYSNQIQFMPLTGSRYQMLAHWPYGTWPFDSPLRNHYDLSCAHYPYFQSMDVRVNTDLSYLPEAYRAAPRCDVLLRRQGTTAAIRTGSVTIAQGKGDLHWDDMKLDAGRYELVGQLVSTDGQPLGEPVVHAFVREMQPWEHNTIGVSDEVFPPFTSILTDEARGTMRCWGKTFAVGSAGLPGVITATDELPTPGLVIAGPTRLEVTSGGTTTSAQGPGRIVAVAPGVVTMAGSADAPPVSIRTAATLRYEGWCDVEVTLTPRAAGKVERIELVIPFASHVDTMYLYRERSNVFTGSIPAGSGEVWNNLRKSRQTAENQFNPVIAIGNGDASLWWLAESDQPWMLDYALASQSIHQTRDGVELRLALVNHPVELREPMTVRYALQASPASPMPAEYRRDQWKGLRRFHDTGGYAYWGSGVDSIWPGPGESYDRLRSAIDQWTGRTKPDAPQPLPPIILYNSGELLGQSMPEFETFSGEWTGRTPVEPTPEYHDSDLHATVTWQRLLKQDWRSQPRCLGPTKADLVQSCVDARIWHYHQNMLKLGVNGYWWDNASIWPGVNVSTGRAYHTAEGNLRPNYPTFLRHQLYRRFFVMYRQAGVEPFQLINQHTSFAFCQWVWGIEGDFYVYRHGGNLYETLERKHDYDIISRVIAVEDTPLDPVARFRGHTRLKRLQGAVVSNLDPRHPAAVHGSRSVLGLALLHDFGVEGGMHRQTHETFVAALEAFGLLDRPDIEFQPYWRNRDVASFSDPAGLVSVYRQPDTGAMLAIVVTPGKELLRGTLRLHTTRSGTLRDAFAGTDAASTFREGWTVADVAVPAREFLLLQWDPTR